MELEIKKICEYEGSTLLGMNGGQPESPDGRLLVYARKPSLSESLTELWVCDRGGDGGLANHRKVFTVACGNHNGPSATFVDNEHIVFRDSVNKTAAFRIVNVHTGEIKYGPIFAKESHCAENGWYPFSISENFLGKNPDYPQIDRCGIYLLELATGQVKCVADKEKVLNMAVEHGCVPNEHTTSMSHVQLNPSATRVMMRLSVTNCPVAMKPIWRQGSITTAQGLRWRPAAYSALPWTGSAWRPWAESATTLTALPTGNILRATGRIPAIPRIFSSIREGRQSPSLPLAARISRILYGRRRYIPTPPFPGTERGFTLTIPSARRGRRAAMWMWSRCWTEGKATALRHRQRAA